MRDKVKIIALFAFMAFVSNFIWESWHASYLYASHTFNLSFWPLMAYAASVDTLLLLGIFFSGVLIWRNFWWFRRDALSGRLYVIFAGIIVAAIIEYKAVYIFHQWIYSPMMPTIFGLGLSPLLQLALTGLLSKSVVRQAIRVSK
ncbi:MAG: hypothetical protein AAB956_03660 [Patescibacteria group bacterium]